MANPLYPHDYDRAACRRCGANHPRDGERRNWTAQIVIASSHEGLGPYFKCLEAEILHVLAHMDDSVGVRQYIAALHVASKQFAAWYLLGSADK